MAIYEKG